MIFLPIIHYELFEIRVAGRLSSLKFEDTFSAIECCIESPQWAMRRLSTYI